MEHRFHQGPYYNQPHTNRNQNRPSSPLGRRPFVHDTPSPSRSPASSAMVHNYGVYGQNGYQQQQQHMMNGGQNHQRYNGMHMPKQQHAFQSSQHHAPQQHGGHMGHQPNLSGGPFQGNNQGLHQYNHDSMMNGARDDGAEDDFISNEHYQEQRRLWEEAKEMHEGAGHHRARQFAQQSKVVPGPFGGPLGAGGDDTTVEEKIRAATAQQQNRNTWSELDMGGQGLRALSPTLFKFRFLTRLDLPGNALRMLPTAIGDLRNLEHLDLSFNNLVSLPDELGMLSGLKTLLLSSNHQLTQIPWSAGYLHKLETLAMFETGYWQEMPPDHKQAFLHGGVKGLVNQFLESMPDDYLPPPTQRAWHQLEEAGAVADETADTFKAVTYNILCERYSSKQKYGYVAERVLNWRFRKQLIFQELQDMDADIICLQELDRASYDDFFRKELSTIGYKGYYAQKSRAETIGDNAKFVDGCGTFWKDQKYIILDSSHLVLGRKAVERPGAKASADMLNRVWQRDDIATVVLLENRFTGSRLIVCNCHVYWDPLYKDVKLVQIAVMMEEVNKLADKYSKHPAATNKKPSWIHDDVADRETAPSLEYSSGSQIPIIVCGDFNSGPGSPVYNLMTRQVLDAHHDDFIGRDYGTLSTGGMSHAFTLKSSNSLISPSPYITNYVPDFADELDHIFYSSKTLRPIGALGPVDQEYLKRVPGFPNQHFPSDHIALMAEFKLEKHRIAQRVEADFGPSSKRS